MPADIPLAASGLVYAGLVRVLRSSFALSAVKSSSPPGSRTLQIKNVNFLGSEVGTPYGMSKFGGGAKQVNAD